MEIEQPLEERRRGGTRVDTYQEPMGAPAVGLQLISRGSQTSKGARGVAELPVSACRAHVRACREQVDDVLYKVDNVSIKGWSLDQVSEVMKGRHVSFFFLCLCLGVRACVCDHMRCILY